MSKWIRKGDKVVIVSGNDKGKTGQVIRRISDRVVVQGINIRKKHAKRRTKAPGTEILEMEMPFHVSKVRLCDGEGNAVRPKVRLNKGGHKELFYFEDDKQIVLRQVKKH